ncbi:MAG: DUF523 and DUF1722 domain-containing protein [Thiovulaceae bacterium]|nr:DUF523 and DUF1722 domain-containing protein [Sulfurimonadaceae bacterium]
MHIAVSACLLGENVRFDGGHKRDEFVTKQISKYASFVSFCPEALAFGIPRPSLRIISDGENERIISNKTGDDLTQAMIDVSKSEIDKITQTPLTGIIFKSRSPSCGMMSAKKYLQNGFNDGKTDGIFMKMCRERFPLLPMEEEGRLQDAWLRENFMMQLFAYDSIEKLKENSYDIKSLVKFHTQNKFLLQAKNEKLYRELGNIVGNHENLSFVELFEAYEQKFKLAISKKSTIKKNRNVLEHMAGFFKKNLSKVEKEVVHEHIQEYADKLVPIIVPLSTIKLFAQKYNTTYLLEQVFLEPYPKELALRSDIDSSK